MPVEAGSGAVRAVPNIAGPELTTGCGVTCRPTRGRTLRRCAMQRPVKNRRRLMGGPVRSRAGRLLWPTWPGLHECRIG